MIVRRRQFKEIVQLLSRTGVYGLDTETTGLTEADRVFSVIVADAHQGYYFNFNGNADHLGQKPEEEWFLPREWLIHFKPLFSNPESTFALHNAKFDLRMLAKEGLEVAGTVHCTEALGRVLKNNHMRYSLEHSAARIGLAKDKSVDEYIKKHKLYEKLPDGEKKPRYDLVPLSIIAAYGETDAVITRKLYEHQVAAFEKQDEERATGEPSCQPIVSNERALTKVCLGMERTGIRVSKSYVQGALAYTQNQIQVAKQSFATLTGIPWDNSPTTIVEAFRKFGVELPKTPTGRPSTNKATLESLADETDAPVAQAIRAIRQPEKLISTYYANFLAFADQDDIIRPNMRQGGTETGRFSYSDPNLQNVPKQDDGIYLDAEKSPYLVRACFIPRPGFCFVPIDFDQQEFKMMLDYAGERELIDQILQGHDVHTATAQLLGITRKQAKTINFGLLYGMGTEKLAKALGISVAEAYELKALYFSKLPRVKWIINLMRETGRSRGYVWNWYGRRLYKPEVPGVDLSFALSNHIIQGGGADVVKVAMTRLDPYIREKGLRSRMLLQIHDEILFEVHKDELAEVAEFKRIMEQVYVPRNGLHLTCSPDHSWKSWGARDRVKGAPAV